MPRSKKVINAIELQDAINAAEAEQQFDSWSELWQAVAKSDWAVAHAISPGTIYQRWVEYGLTCRTKPARKQKKVVEEPAIEEASSAPQSVGQAQPPQPSQTDSSVVQERA